MLQNPYNHQSVKSLLDNPHLGLFECSLSFTSFNNKILFQITLETSTGKHVKWKWCLIMIKHVVLNILTNFIKIHIPIRVYH